MLGEPLLLIGRQVRTLYGGIIDLLAIDIDGNVHVIELKRDRTPRDVVAQALDYGSWVADLSHSEVVEIFENYRADEAFDAVFAEFFDVDAPDEVNGSQVFTIVAASVDPVTERIIKFLNESFNVPVNVVFFRHFDDAGASYLARTWLVSQGAEETSRTTPKAQRTREPWNGRDWYVAFGESPEGRNWEDARKFGFVSAGGDTWYSRTLKNLPIGARVFACVPKKGYVGIGKVTGEATPFTDAVVSVNDVEGKLAGLPLVGSYKHSPEGDTDESAEYVVPVEWEETVAVEEAIWKTGMFANQNSACKLRKQFTIDTVTTALGVSTTD